MAFELDTADGHEDQGADPSVVDDQECLAWRDQCRGRLVAGSRDGRQSIVAGSPILEQPRIAFVRVHRCSGSPKWTNISGTKNVVMSTSWPLSMWSTSSEKARNRWRRQRRLRDRARGRRRCRGHRPGRVAAKPGRWAGPDRRGPDVSFRSASQGVDAKVGRDPVQPGPQRGAPLELTTCPPSSQEPVLSVFLGVAVGAEHPVAVHAELAAVRFD